MSKATHRIDGPATVVINGEEVELLAPRIRAEGMESGVFVAYRGNHCHGWCVLSYVSDPSPLAAEMLAIKPLVAPRRRVLCRHERMGRWVEALECGHEFDANRRTRKATRLCGECAVEMRFEPLARALLSLPVRRG